MAKGVSIFWDDVLAGFGKGLGMCAAVTLWAGAGYLVYWLLFTEPKGL